MLRGLYGRLDARGWGIERGVWEVDGHWDWDMGWRMAFWESEIFEDSLLDAWDGFWLGLERVL